MSIDLDDLRQTINDRLKSPFFGPLILAFVACNWKSILALFYPEDNWTFFQRIDDIHNSYYQSVWDVFWFVYAIPLAVALFAATWLPHILTTFDRIAHKAIVKRKLERARQEAALPENVKQMLDLQSKSSGLENEIGQLRNELNSVRGLESEKSLMLAKALKAMVEYDPEIKRIVIKLYKQPQELAQSKQLQFLQSINLVDGSSTGKYELSEVGNGVARTQSAAGLPPENIL